MFHKENILNTSDGGASCCPMYRYGSPSLVSGCDEQENGPKGDEISTILSFKMWVSCSMEKSKQPLPMLFKILHKVDPK